MFADYRVSYRLEKGEFTKSTAVFVLLTENAAVLSEPCPVIVER